MARKKPPTTEPEGKTPSGLITLSDGTRHYTGVPADPTLGYIRCEWFAGRERCRYPGSMSTNTKGGGPWYCSTHWHCTDPLAGADVVEASRNYSHPTPERTERQIQARADQTCARLGLKTTAEKRAWVLDQAHRLAKKWDAKPLLREPGEDES